MRRREFIAGLGAAAAWPLATLAQQSGRKRRIGVLLNFENDALGKARLALLTQGLGEMGWIDGRNVQIDVRWAANKFDRTPTFAKELVDLQPDVIVVSSLPVTRAVQQQTRTIPIVFLTVGDPVASALVGSLSHPEGNTTGFASLFASIAGKWLELLKEAAPRVAKVALVFNPEFAGSNYLPVIEAAAAQFAVAAIRTPVRNVVEIGRAIEAFATEPNGGLILVPPPFFGANQELINRLAVRHRLAAMYSSRDAAGDGGLLSYGTDPADLYRRGGPSYVDRILRGAKVSDLPIQFPTKFELVINLKTAKAMGLTIPESFLLRADEVIE